MGRKSRRHNLHQRGTQIQKENIPPKNHDDPVSEEQHRADERHFWERQIRVSKWLNWITGIGSAVALIGLTFLYSSVRDAEQATEYAYRAYVAPRGLDILSDALPGHPIQFSMKYENIGKQPATNFTYGNLWNDSFDGPPIVRNSSDAFPLIKPNGTCIPPVSGKAPEWPLNGGEKDQYLFTQGDPKFIADWPLILAQKKTYYVEGCFSYVTFGQPHYTKFCYFLHVSGDSGPGPKTLKLVFAVCPNLGTSDAD